MHAYYVAPLRLISTASPPTILLNEPSLLRLLATGTTISRRLSLQLLLLLPPPLVLDLLLAGDREGVDAEEVADAGDDEVRPAEVHDEREEEVRPEVEVLGAGGDGREAEDGEVAQRGAADQRRQHDGPVGEGLARQVGEDHLGGHAAEDERHGQAEQHEVVLTPQRRVRAVQPRPDRERVHRHGRPLEEDGEHGLPPRPPRPHHVQHAERHVPEHERADDDGDPGVADGVFSDEVGVPEQVLGPAGELDDGARPDVRAENTGERHDGGGDQEALGGAVEVAQVQGVRVVGLPGGEEHGEAGAQSGEDARLGRAERHGGRLQQAAQRAVQRVDAVVEELSQSARCPCPPRLLPVHVVHRLVHEESEREAEVEP